MQLPARPRRQLLQHAALQHTGPRLRRPEHRRFRHLQIHPGKAVKMSRFFFFFPPLKSDVQCLTISFTKRLPLPVRLRSRRLLLLRPPDAVVAAPADGRAGLRWDTLLLCGGEDGELLYRFAGPVESRLDR